MAYRRGLALLLCLLIVGSSVTAVLATQDSSMAIDRTNQASVDTPTTLSISEDRSNFTTPGIVVTDALTIGHQSTKQGLSDSALQTRLSNVETEQARIRVLSNATTELSQAVSELATHSQSVRQQYRQGSISTRKYANLLAQIHTRADSLVNTATLIEDRAPPESQLVSRAVQLRAQLMTYTGPVRDQIAAAVTDGEDPDQVYVGAGANGTTTAVIDDGTYIREANRPSQYDSTAGQVPEAEPLLENIRQQYPWVMNQSAGISFTPLPIESSGPQYAYWLTLRYPQGEVNAYVDTSTDSVYQEVQRIDLAMMNPSADVSIQKNGYTMSVSRSYAGGPMQINVTTTDGRPAQAQLSLNNETVDSTGRDGVQWTLSPATNYTVTATIDETELQIEDIQPTAN